MLYKTVCLFLFVALCASGDTYDPQKNVLILTENVWIKESHSLFIKQLTERGFQPTVRVADDPSLTLTKYGEYLYRHVILLAPSVNEFGGSLSVKELVKFIDEGGNVVVTGSSDIGEAIRDLGSECGVEFDESGTAVIDHFNYDVADDGTHTKIVVSPKNLIKSSVIVGSENKNDFLYRGVGISSDPTNPLLVNILQADRTAYSYSTSKSVIDYPNTVGTNTHLIVALQARNNARVLFLGSLDFLSNEFFRSSTKAAISEVICKVDTDRPILGEGKTPLLSVQLYHPMSPTNQLQHISDPNLGAKHLPFLILL
ncbi:unnamed protein product [Echinostoma caproni]|uniref:Dolichyl-diphosphooligosaccharide--protein glycosyltransferase 48 kDa subunit n=1 Tax=Echinostoma caproni TaxID=27848 RepID=A0A183BF47_9TREM|nr:unnamed protein product [Echinostoma caproni]